MCESEKIKKVIEDIIRTDESIVYYSDFELLCKDYDNTKLKLKELMDKKQELYKSLEDKMNEFLKIKNNWLTKKLKINTFRLIPNPLSNWLKFSLPPRTDKTSRQYYCYQKLMYKLSREYNSIDNSNGEYFLLDLSAGLNLNSLLKDD